MTILGMDIGGTKTAAVLYEAGSWSSLGQETIPTEASRGFSAVIDQALALAARVKRKDTMAVGIGCAGLVRMDGTVLRSPNIPGGEEFPLAAHASAKLELPVAAANDVQCFTLGEALHGAGRGRRVVVGITMGTGVGGGLVIDGRLLRGEHGFCAEFGHMLLRPGEPPFPTEDRRGEVEQFLSGTAMGKRCEAAQRPSDYLEGEVCAFLRPEVFREVAWLLASLTHALDPSIVVLGGSTGRALQPHLPQIREQLAQWILPKIPLPELAIGQRVDAGTLGAALLASIRN